VSLVTRPYNFTPGTTAYSAQVNQNESVLYGAINGQLDSTNISLTRGIQANYINATGGNGAFQAGSYQFTPATSSSTPLAVVGAPLQTAALQTWGTSVATVAGVDQVGNIFTTGNLEAANWNNVFSSTTGFYISGALVASLTASGFAAAGITVANAITAQNLTVNSTITAAVVNASSIVASNIQATTGLTSPLLDSLANNLQLFVNSTQQVANFTPNLLTLPSIGGAMPGLTLGSTSTTAFAINNSFGSVLIPSITNDTTGGINYQSVSASGLGHRFYYYNAGVLSELAGIDTSGNLFVGNSITANGNASFGLTSSANAQTYIGSAAGQGFIALSNNTPTPTAANYITRGTRDTYPYLYNTYNGNTHLSAGTVVVTTNGSGQGNATVTLPAAASYASASTYQIFLSFTGTGQQWYATTVSAASGTQFTVYTTGVSSTAVTIYYLCIGY
jgi:hypothetical protein